MVNNENGDSLIGVYKRSIRIGLEMVDRGHEVWMLCTGREQFHDELTKQAEARFHFADFPSKVIFSRSLELRRRYSRMVFRRLHPDIVVVGEAPLSGPMLEYTLCAVSLGIRVVALDNAYSPNCCETFVAHHGPMLDGMILTGLSSFQMQDPPNHYCPVAPYIQGSSAEAETTLKKCGCDGKKLVTVLGYERKAEQLAAALLPALAKRGCAVVFLAPKPKETEERLNSLRANVLTNTHVLPLPSEELLFGLLKMSSLVIGKCGFMQVSECLALRTPFLGIQYRGCFPLTFLSREARRFVVGTYRTDAQRKTVRAAMRLLHTSREDLSRLHDGSFGSRSAVVDFLERLPPLPRAETMEECAKRGYTSSILLDILSKRHPGTCVSIDAVRCTRIRDTDWGNVDSVVCTYTSGSSRKYIFLWGRKYYSDRSAADDIRSARSPSSVRQLLFVSQDGRFMIEEDIGEWQLAISPLGAVLFRDLKLAVLKDPVVSWLQRIRLIFQPPLERTKRRSGT